MDCFVKAKSRRNIFKALGQDDNRKVFYDSLKCMVPSYKGSLCEMKVEVTLPLPSKPPAVTPRVLYPEHHSASNASSSPVTVPTPV